MKVIAKGDTQQKKLAACVCVHTNTAEITPNKRN